MTSDPAGVATFNSGTKVITVPTGPGANAYRFVLLDLASLISTLGADTLSSITSFKVTLNALGDIYFDNLSAGTLQPANSLAFSYDVYNGQVDQAYIRTGALAWVAYAYAVYMAASLDTTPALYLERLLNYPMALAPFDVDYESNTTRFVLELRIVKALFWRKTGLSRGSSVERRAQAQARRFRVALLPDGISFGVPRLERA